jgi:hypothetical protein
VGDRNSGNIFEFIVQKYTRNRHYSSWDKIFVDQCYQTDMLSIFPPPTLPNPTLHSSIPSHILKQSSCLYHSAQTLVIARNTAHAVKSSLQQLRYIIVSIFVAIATNQNDSHKNVINRQILGSVSYS